MDARFALAALLARGAANPPVAARGRAAAPPAAWILPAIALSGAVSFGIAQLEIAEALPEEIARDLRSQLQSDRPSAVRH